MDFKLSFRVAEAKLGAMMTALYPLGVGDLKIEPIIKDKEPKLPPGPAPKAGPKLSRTVRSKPLGRGMRRRFVLDCIHTAMPEGLTAESLGAAARRQALNVKSIQNGALQLVAEGLVEKTRDGRYVVKGK